MTKIKDWFEMLCFGDTRRYSKLLLWFLLDSVIATIPYSIVILAIYVFLIPVAGEGQLLPVSKLWMLTGVLAVQAFCYFLVRRKSYVDSCVGMAGTMRKSRIEVGEHLRILPMGFFNNHDAGELSTVLLRDYNTVETLAEQFMPQVTAFIVRLVISAIFLGIFDYRMTFALLITIPLSLPFAFVSYSRMKDSGAHLQKAQQDTTSRILEYIEGIQTLKAFNMAGRHFQALQEAFDRQRKSAIHIETKSAAPMSILGKMILNMGLVLTIIAGGVWVVNGTLNPFFYIAFLVMALNVYEPVSVLFMFIADFARSRRSGERIRGLFEEKPLPEPRGTSPRGCKNGTIAFEHVSFSYGDKEVLHDVSVTFPEKTVTALVGPSGSGKSTITRLAARFWDVNKGQITLGGVPLTNMKVDEILAQVSIVFQDVYLFHDTIEANIRMGREDATREEVIEAAKKAACHDFIMSLPDKYDTIVGEGGSTLSGGEKQRISIARALLKDAPIVLLDEATASLDSENEVLIQQAISSLVESKTVIIIAHRLQSIFNADQILVLKDGQIAEKGTHTELLAQKGIYEHLWKEQSSSGSWRIK